MATYFELVKKDVCLHEACEDASLWPPSVTLFVDSLKDALKLPRWLKSGPVPFTSKRMVGLLDQILALDDDLWDSTDQVMDEETEKRLRVVLNTALVDCARIQAVIETEDATDTPYPKESFLIVLVRDAILDAHAQLSALEDTPVVLPRHFSGEAIPILEYMVKTFYVPLIISICQEIPFEESSSDRNHQSDSESSKYSPPTLYSPLSLSEWLDGSSTSEEVEEEQEQRFLSTQFEAYFSAYSPSATPPSRCHIPILCMADEEQLSVSMSSLLYQRRVWHIKEPLVGLSFSKYGTAIRIFVGWLDDKDELPSDRVLPQVHLREIVAPVVLDLSLPSAAVVICRLLCSLERHIVAVHDSVRASVSGVANETQSCSPLSWRIDTDIDKGDPGLERADNGSRDMISQWVKSQSYSESEEARMPSRYKKPENISSSGSGTSMPPPQPSTATQRSYPTSQSSFASKEGNLQIPEVREPHGCGDDVPTFCSRLSCSEFAETTEKNDHRVFRWMFDRRVIPQSIAFDLSFREEYSATTCFIWPETWKARENLPSVDPSVEPCVEELLKDVSILKTRPGAVKCIPVKEFPVDLQILEQSFSAIFQASRRSREKTKLEENISEVNWRHDHDRLLFDFFIRLVEQRKCDTLVDGRSIGQLEDPVSRPMLEATLRFPKSDNMQKSGRVKFQLSIGELINRSATDLQDWLESRGSGQQACLQACLQELENTSYVSSQWTIWRREIDAETEAQMISRLGQFPSTGRCDAFGRLLVNLPNVSSKVVRHLRLVDSPAKKHDGAKGKDVTASARTPRARKDQDETSTKTSNSLAVPDSSFGAPTETGGARYDMLLSSIPTSTSTQPSDEEKDGSAESIDKLADKVHHVRLADAARLELPILTVENKKTSDGAMKGTNQLRMYLTASAKFLQAVGITNFPVYGVQTDGPIVVLPVAILRDDNFVYLFERLVERIDISTPLGAWHYATILCRLAGNHASTLERKFEEVRDKLIASLLSDEDRVEGWKIDEQRARLECEGKVKFPPQKKQKSEKED